MPIISIYKHAGPVAVERAIAERRVIARSLTDNKVKIHITDASMLEKVMRENDLMAMVRIPEGRARIQSSSNVEVGSFWLALTPVTRAQLSLYFNKLGFETGQQGPAGFLPAGDVPYYQAFEFADWAKMRLPSELQWEKACRGTHGNLYSWGDSNVVPPGVAFNLAKDPQKISGPAPVDRSDIRNTASAYGVLDLSGNIWEWTSSTFYFSEINRWAKADGNTRSLLDQLKSGADHAGVSDDPLMNVVVRGGSWAERADQLDHLRGDFRRGVGIDLSDLPGKDVYGFRLAANYI
ncbi:MAG: SUMF1/EgtB/PvdO family nonheme iron enzyme [Candidatus Margulisiibacteriota bacterium]